MAIVEIPARIRKWWQSRNFLRANRTSVAESCAPRGREFRDRNS